VFPVAPEALDAFVVDVDGGASARDLTAVLRRAGLRADRAFDSRSIKSQLRSADRSGARVALIVGPDEVAAGTVSVRPLRGTGVQRTVDRSSVVEAVRVEAGH
jgi:histidyl-tRNA synthetase